MNPWVAWMLVGLGFAAIAARRGTAAVLVGAQTLLVGAAAAAIAPGRSAEFALAAALLLAKAIAVAVILAVGLAHTREARPYSEGVGPLVRLGGAVALAVALVALMPDPGPGGHGAGAAGAAMLAASLCLVLFRRATAFAVFAFLVAENAVAVVALSQVAGLPLIVDLGVVFDLVVVISIAAVLQRRILAVFGTTDSDVLQSMRG